MKLSNGLRPRLPPESAFAGYRFSPEVIVVAVHWYLRYKLSYRDVGELLVERGIVGPADPGAGIDTPGPAGGIQVVEAVRASTP